MWLRALRALRALRSLAAAVLAASGLPIDGALAQMDHGAMEKQSGRAPADARDPHAYSDGHTLTEGPYALPGPHHLTMADQHTFWAVLGDRFEYQADSEAAVYDLLAWYGTTYDRFVGKAEGDIADGKLVESVTQLLWGHALGTYFDSQLGLRIDQYDEGSGRQWLALGLQGLAPYWFELEITAYVGDSGRTALKAEAEYDVLLTQRLVLQPRAALNAYGKADPENGLGAGISNTDLGLRLRYEISRQFAPYVGLEWTRSYGDTAEYRRAAGESQSEAQIVAGLRFWF